jgi:hypothetical protein
MRTDAKVDANQASVMASLRKAGCSVQSLAAIGKGCPDLLVSFGGHNVLVEVKDGNKPPSAQKLTADQEKWHERWQSKVWIVRDVLDAAHVVMWLRSRQEVK